eukprot:1481644-Rhodomonas_salina.1
MESQRRRVCTVPQHRALPPLIPVPSFPSYWSLFPSLSCPYPSPPSIHSSVHPPQSSFRCSSTVHANLAAHTYQVQDS